nr:MAG TPA: hypothetical protein [Caudoviricetes sp.]
MHSSYLKSRVTSQKNYCISVSSAPNRRAII